MFRRGGRDSLAGDQDAVHQGVDTTAKGRPGGTVAHSSFALAQRPYQGGEDSLCFLRVQRFGEAKPQNPFCLACHFGGQLVSVPQ